MGKFTAEKVFDGYTTCFRQWKAVNTHCSFLHGYGVSFKVWYEGELDSNNWVFDFGRAKRSEIKIQGKNPKEWLDWLLDHTTIIAKDDPELGVFYGLNHKKIIQLRVVENVGAERFAEFLYHKLNDWVVEDSNGRVKITKIEFRENNKNSATYYGI